jgi:MFS family permease
MTAVPSRATRIAIFAALCWLYACIHLDRQMLAVLAESIKSDLALSDRQLGTLTGPAFSIVYALLGLLFGRFADHFDRRRLVVSGALVWSVASMAGALARGYGALVAARAGVALGEAIGTAAAVSLMAGVAGQRYRARAMSFFAAFAFAGAGCAAILGGWVASSFVTHWTAGWRAALLVAGMPGIAGALCLLCLPSPEAPAAQRALQQVIRPVVVPLTLAAGLAMVLQMQWRPEAAVPVSIAVALLAGAWWVRDLYATDRAAYGATFGVAAYRWVLVTFSAGLFVDCAAEFWLFPYAQRTFDVGAARVGADLGALLIGGGIAGSLAGGWLADSWRRVSASGRVWAALVAVLAETLAILDALAQSNYAGLLVAFGALCIAAGAWVGVAAAIGLDIVPPRHRGTGTGAYFLITTLLGPGLGPFAVGLQSDRSGSLGQALAASTVIMLIAVIGLVRLGRQLRESPQP